MEEKRRPGRPRKRVPALGDPNLGQTGETRLFAAIVLELLEELDCSTRELAANAGVDPTTMSHWLNPDTSKIIPKGDVNRICWALCGLQDKSLERGRTQAEQRGGRDDNGRGQLGSLLRRLLRAAGYKTVEDQGQTSEPNLVWERLSNIDEQKRMLRVGFYETWPLFVSGYGAALPPDGFAARITNRMASYMGVKIEWVYLEGRQPISALTDGTIDVLAPRMALPRRMFVAAFSSRPLKDFKSGVNALIHRDGLRDVLGSEGNGPKTKGRSGSPVLSEAQLDRLQFTYTGGNLGLYGLEFFREGHPAGKELDVYEIKPEDLRKDKIPKHEDWLYVIRNRKDESTGRVRCLLLGQLLCHNFIRQPNGIDELADERQQLTTLLPMRHSVGPVPYAYSVLYSEDRLLRIIDDCLAHVFDDRQFMSDLHAEYRDTLAELDQVGVYQPPPTDNTGSLHKEQS